METIQDFINERHKYKADLTYQRPEGVWSPKDSQCLIDTILKGEPMPLFFLNYKSQEDVHYIVDGQQRLHAIKLFYDNKLKLHKEFSGVENHGKTFGDKNPISDGQRKDFLDYKLRFHIMEDYDDEKVRMLYSRLQRGKPLTIGERFNAKPGEIVPRMREIAKHPFMSKSIAVSKERYGNYPDAIRALFYEKRGCRDSGTPAIELFFDDNKKILKRDNGYKSVISILDFLERCFPPVPGEYKHLSKHAWVFAVYTMVRDLKIAHGYVLHGKEKLIGEFIKDFHSKVYSQSFRDSNRIYQRFYDRVRGGWSERIIAFRRDTLIQEFLKKYKDKLEILDDRRQPTEGEMIECFAIHSDCQMCGKKFKDYREPEYHHDIMYSKGGKRKENLIVLCKECHKKVHGKEKIELATEEPIEEEMNENDGENN